MGKIRRGLAWIATALLRLLAAAGIFILTSLVIFVAGLVITAFPCLAVFCIVQLCGPVLRIGVIWLAAAAAAWLVLELMLLRKARRNRNKAREEVKEAGDGAEENKAV